MNIDNSEKPKPLTVNCDVNPLETTRKKSMFSIFKNCRVYGEHRTTTKPHQVSLLQVGFYVVELLASRPAGFEFRDVPLDLLVTKFRESDLNHDCRRPGKDGVIPSAVIFVAKYYYKIIDQI